jgi:hypothetical protein
MPGEQAHNKAHNGVNQERIRLAQVGRPLEEMQPR